MAKLTQFSGRAVPLASAVLLLFFLLIILAPDRWSGNEIVYFDLAHRWIDPARFTEFHAMRDFSIARIVSFMAMGAGIEVFGMEGAYRVFGFAFLLIVPIAYVALTRSLDGDFSIAALSLFVLLLYGRQSAVGGEFIFGSVEPKTFAYAFVLFGLACMFSERRRLASCLLVGAIYFHFLVGVFWGVAALGYWLLVDGNARRIRLPFALIVGLSLPLFFAILHERLGHSAISIDPSGPSLNAIYAEFRNPHHIAPFADMKVFFSTWFWGIALHAATAILFCLQAVRGDQRARVISIWIAGLNAYVLVAAMIAFLDRHTHALSALYLFRPSALILLLSILWGVAQIFGPILRLRRLLSLTAAALALAVSASAALHSAVMVARGPAPLASLMTPSEVLMVEWISKNTPAQAVFLVEPLSAAAFMGERDGVWAGIERLIDRPTLVSYKLVPTKKSDLARWYNLMMWRQAVFEGDCQRLKEQPVEYLITRSAGSVERLVKCSEVAWRGGENTILRVAPKGHGQMRSRK